MERSLVFLLVVGSLVGAGIILSFYGAQLTTQNLSVVQENLLQSSSIEVIAELDPSVSETGVYGILVEKFEEGTISVLVIDPLGNQITSKVAEKESTEEQFTIVSSGIYKLIIENSGLEETQVVAGIGHMPDVGTLSVGITGFYILIVGLIGIVTMGFLVIKNRRKQKFS